MKESQTSKRPTIKDVAELAGVSRTTVSYVTNKRTDGNIRISDETRKKVWAAVETLGYRPSGAARALRTNRSNLIALMVPFIDTPFNPLFAAAIQREAEKENLGVIIYAPRDDPDREKEFVNDCIARGVDGFIAQTYQLSEEDINQMVSAGIGVVIHGITPKHPFADNIILDEVKASEEIVSYLVEQGHSRIAIIAGPYGKWTGRLRKEGYLNALHKNGISIDDEIICEAPTFTRGSGIQCMQTLLSLSEPPTAVFAANDVLAVDALHVALDHGLSVPQDIAIVGFDDTPEAIIVRPKLTTVHKDIDLLGISAVEMLVDRINSKAPLPARTKTLEYQLKIRDSA